MRPGEIFGFLGPNGAGKTTSIKMLLGLVRPTAATGACSARRSAIARRARRVGFLPEHFRFHDWLTGRELLRFHGRLYGLRRLRPRDADRSSCWRASTCSTPPIGRCAATARACCSARGWRRRS